MKGPSTVVVSLILLLTLFASGSVVNTDSALARSAGFTANYGQWDEQVKFRTEVNGAVVWICLDRVVYQFLRPDDDNPLAPEETIDEATLQSINSVPVLKQLVLEATFMNTSPTAGVTAARALAHKKNFFLGKSSASWRVNVPSYESVTLTEIYNGINIEFSLTDGHLTHQYHLSPGADHSAIQISYNGIESVRYEDGEVAKGLTDWGEVVGIIAEPLDNTASQPVRFSGVVGADPLPTHSLQGDPRDSQSLSLVYSTYLGGASVDYGYGITVDASGNAYIVGDTPSSDFPLDGWDEEVAGSYDAFLVKLNAAGDDAIFSTLIGGTVADNPRGVQVDAAGNVIIAGFTASGDFPTMSAYQDSARSSEAFVAKFNSTGDALIYSTYIGGGAAETCHALSIDSAGNAYITGYTTSSDFPTVNALQTDQSGTDAYVAKLNAAGNGLVYSTYLGGNNIDNGADIAVDASGNAFIVGNTASTDFPTQNPIQEYGGIRDAFVTKINSSGTAYIYSTFIGGGGFDVGRGVAIDESGNAYVAGDAASSDFPTVNPLQEDLVAGNDAFICKVNAAGSALEYSTFLGGSGNDWLYGISIDESGNACVIGETYSSDFPTQDPVATYSDALADVVAAKLNASGNSLIYSTYLGGDGNDRGHRVAVDAVGDAYLTGYTYSTDFQTVGPYQTNLDGNDAFVTKLQGGDIVFACGDPDGSGGTAIGDAVYLVNYIFAFGPAPLDEKNGDCDCSGDPNITDAVYIVNFIFGGGPAPCDGCP